MSDTSPALPEVFTGDCAIVGGGAAGFFACANLGRYVPGVRMTIFEKTGKFLSKVLISGGGRCNVTHNCSHPADLIKGYPRGNPFLKKSFFDFNNKDVVRWFEDCGVPIKTEDDGRMFPQSNSSASIANCLLDEARRFNTNLLTGVTIVDYRAAEDGVWLTDANGAEYRFRTVIFATGGHPMLRAYAMFQHHGYKVLPPIPSLFTFECADHTLSDLSGISVPEARVSIAGAPQKQSGPLLITHRGLSGPAVIKLSAWAAEELHQRNYKFTALVHWAPQYADVQVRQMLNEAKSEQNMLIRNYTALGLPKRLWLRMCEKAGAQDKRVADLSKKEINVLAELVCAMELPVDGKNTFKEEFVTCGGIDTDEINRADMSSKRQKGVYFAGELINVDGVTGGFNFQAAWTTGYLAAHGAADYLESCL